MMNKDRDKEVVSTETEEDELKGIVRLRDRLKQVFAEDYRPTGDEYAKIIAQEGFWSESLALQRQFSNTIEALLEFSEDFSKRVQELETSQPKLKAQTEPLRQDVEELNLSLTNVQEAINTMKEKLPQEFFSLPEFKQSIEK